MPYPDDYSSQNAPDSERRASRAEALTAEYATHAARWEAMRDSLTGLANTIRSVDPHSAAHAELADMIEGVITDADGFCAIDMLASGDDAKIERAAAIWDARVERRPTAAEILHAACGRAA